MKALTDLIHNALAWLTAQIEWVKGFLNNADGKASATSLMKLAVIYIWAKAFIKVTYENSGIIPAISWEWIVFLSAIIGLTPIFKMVMAFINIKNGKAVQDEQK